MCGWSSSPPSCVATCGRCRGRGRARDHVLVLVWWLLPHLPGPGLVCLESLDDCHTLSGPVASLQPPIHQPQYHQQLQHWRPEL